MQKLITYLKQGKGRGLLAMLIFSVLVALISWGLNYLTLEQYAQLYAVPASKMIWIHAGVIFTLFAFIWVLYGIVMGISALLALAFKLKLSKGFICRASFVTFVGLFTLSILFSLIAFILSFFGGFALLFYPIIIMILLPVLLVMIIAFSARDPKEEKKKK